MFFNYWIILTATQQNSGCNLGYDCVPEQTCDSFQIDKEHLKSLQWGSSEFKKALNQLRRLVCDKSQRKICCPIVDSLLVLEKPRNITGNTSTCPPLVGNHPPPGCNKTFIEDVDGRIPCEDDQDCPENKDRWIDEGCRINDISQGIESDHNIRLNLSAIDIFKFKNIVILQSHLVLVSEIV